MLTVTDKAWKTNQAKFFCDRQVYKFLPINLGACKPIFFFFLKHLIWGERVLWGTGFIIHTLYKMQCSKNFRNHLYGHPVLTFDKRQICEEILKELRFNVIKNLLSLFFIHGFTTMCNLNKRLMPLGILSTPASDVYEWLKTNGKAMKITLLRLPTINKEI